MNQNLCGFLYILTNILFCFLFIGEKCCLHIHGVFPYIFVELDESLEANDKSILYNFANSLDKALCLAIGTTNSKSRHIHNILIVSGK